MSRCEVAASAAAAAIVASDAPANSSVALPTLNDVVVVDDVAIVLTSLYQSHYHS